MMVLERPPALSVMLMVPFSSSSRRIAASRSVRRFPLGGRGKFGHPDLAELGGFAWLIALHQQIQRRDSVTDRHVCIHTLCLAPGVGIDVADNHGMDDRPQGTQ